MLKLFRRDRQTETATAGATAEGVAAVPVAAANAEDTALGDGTASAASPAEPASGGVQASTTTPSTVAMASNKPPTRGPHAPLLPEPPPRQAETVSVTRKGGANLPAVASKGGRVPADGIVPEVFAGTTSASFEPVAGLIGIDAAREAVRSIRRLEPRGAAFVVVPRTSAHQEALRSLLAQEAAAIEPGEAVAVVARFEGNGGLEVLRLSEADAGTLSEGVSQAIGMLSVTVPAAFESDSYRVARIALDEELRSGHDGALDALRRKAHAQNIGLLRTTNGYAVVPMHDGRVVRGEVYGALPGSLKSDVEAKLAAFEAELADVLKHRALLQQDHHRRAKELERDAASLAVDAALGSLAAAFERKPDLARWLARLRSDLVENALLFVAAHRDAQGAPRAPIEIALDKRLKRYRVNVLARSGVEGEARLVQPEQLDRAELAGVIQAVAPGDVAPDGVSAGALTLPGGGLVVIDVRDLMAGYASWPLIKHALKAAKAGPVAVGESGVQRVSGFDLPVEVRLVVTGEAEDYAAWCRLDPDVARLVRPVTVFKSALPAVAATHRMIARHLAGFVRDDGLLPFDGPALAGVVSALRVEHDDGVQISTDLQLARDLMAQASVGAHTAGRAMVLADDVASVRSPAGGAS